jgi:sphingosine kinase
MKKRLKVLVNPCGGQGKAKQIFETKVQPLFEVAKCTVDVQCKSGLPLVTLNSHTFC